MAGWLLIEKRNSPFRPVADARFLKSRRSTERFSGTGLVQKRFRSWLRNIEPYRWAADLEIDQYYFRLSGKITSRPARAITAPTAAGKNGSPRFPIASGLISDHGSTQAARRIHTSLWVSQSRVLKKCPKVQQNRSNAR